MPPPEKTTALFPGLRQDLRLHPGPRSSQGSPTWTLHDPARQQFFRLGWPEFEILQRLSLNDPDRIQNDIQSKTSLTIHTQQVTDFVRFLAINNLTNATGEEGLHRLRTQALSQQRHWTTHLLHTYLFFRIPLLKPDRFLSRVTPWVAWMFSGQFLVVLGLAALMGLYLIGQQWEAFFTTFSHLFTWQGMLLFVVTISLVKIAHELGHACAAKHFGCRIPTMGIAFLVMWPVLYTDTTDAWKLVGRRERLIIVASGVLVELTLAVMATFSWSFLADGPLRSATFFVATTSWMITLAINLSPFLRFDGYYLLSDWVDIQNLHERATAMGRWWLRRMLFGWELPCPEILPLGRRRFMILFAYVTWFYRLIVFLGIALLVYHFFFKVAGIFLMAVEIAWFTALPIGRELGYWMKERQNINLNARSITTGLVVCILLFLTTVPWSTHVKAPAVLRQEHHIRLFSQVAGQVETLAVAEGDRVQEGDLLVRLDVPDLAHEITQVERQIALSRWQLAFHGMSAELSEQSPVVRQELETSLTKFQGLKEKRNKTSIHAPFSGEVVYVAEHLKQKDWINENTWLLELVRPKGWMVEAYVEESDLGRIGLGTTGSFYPEIYEWPKLEATVTRIDSVSVKELGEPWLASIFEGGIPVREGEHKKLIPETSVYRVTLGPRDMSDDWRPLLRGTIILNGTAQSLFSRAWKAVIAVLVRESGF